MAATARSSYQLDLSCQRKEYPEAEPCVQQAFPVLSIAGILVRMNPLGVTYFGNSLAHCCNYVTPHRRLLAVLCSADHLY